MRKKAKIIGIVPCEPIDHGQAGMSSENEECTVLEIDEQAGSATVKFKGDRTGRYLVQLDKIAIETKKEKQC